MMNRSRKRKHFWTANCFSEYEPKLKRIKTELPYKTKKKHNKVISRNLSALRMANVRQVRIILDRTIVDKYLQAKQMLRDILSSRPLRIAYRRRNEKKSKKQTSLLDYMQLKNDATKNASQIREIKKESAKVIDQNNTGTAYDVNIIRQPAQIMYYMDNGTRTYCFMHDNNLVILPSNAQFTPEEFIYNNYGFLPLMGFAQIKTEYHQDLPVKEEIDETSINSSIAIYDHTISNIEDIARASIPSAVKGIHNEQTLINCYSDEEATAVVPAKCDISIFDEETMKLCKSDNETKFDKSARLDCPATCDRSFEMSEAFKQHKLLCGLEFLYECLYCDYSAKIVRVFKKHLVRMHKAEVENEGLESILMKVLKGRMDKKTLSSVMPKESDVESGAEESHVKSIESKFIASKLTFDLFCPACERTFKRINGIPMKMCQDCQVTLVFKCQTCAENFVTYSKAYHHVSNKCGSSLKKHSTNKRNSINCLTYKCDYCDFETYYKSAIREHIFRWHMKNDKSHLFKCDLCSFQTLYPSNLRRHKRNVHKLNVTIDLDE